VSCPVKRISTTAVAYMPAPKRNVARIGFH